MHRDLESFDKRAPGYDQGRLGRLHHEIADKTAKLAIGIAPAPESVLDVGCGTGYLLRVLAAAMPAATRLYGIDPSNPMIELAAESSDDERIRFSLATAERLPFADDQFDLIVSTTAFDHWSDQQLGLLECGRVLAPGGWLVLVDLFSLWFWPTLTGNRRHKARTRRRASRQLEAAGFKSATWHRIYLVIINAVSVTR